MSELFNQAVAAHSAGRIVEAMALYAKVLQQQPQHAQALELLGVAHAQTGDSERGLALLDQALSLTPQNPALLNNRGNMLRTVGRLDEAIASFDLAISLVPHYAEALNNRANSLQDLERTDEAIADYQQAIKLQPHYTEAIYNLGVALQAANRPEEAVQQFEEALRLSPNTHQIHGRLAISLLKLNRDAEALQQIDMALALAPDATDHLLVKGNILNAQSHYVEALVVYDQALQKSPRDTDILNSSAIALMRSGRYKDAVARCEMAIAINPQCATAYANRASSKILSNDLQGAESDIKQSLLIDAENADAWVAQGALLAARNDHQSAVECYKKAVQLEPYSADPYYCIGLSLMYLRLHSQALQFLLRARELNSNLDFLHGNIIQCKMAVCAWDGLSNIFHETIQKLKSGGRPSYPFQLMMVSDDAEMLYRCTIEANKIYNQPVLLTRSVEPNVSNSKVRLGYVSADFHTHPVSQLLIRIIELHNRNQFEVLAFSIDPLPSDSMRERLKEVFDEFIDIHQLSNLDGARLIREKNIDILIDLTGLTQNCRPEIFNAKPAPVQINYLGYPCTTGSSGIDYIVGDEVTTPFEFRKAYSEHITQLPQCYLPYNSLQPISEKPINRASHQLPESAFVFCCFNSSQKINPESFKNWCKVLMAVDDSVLWLKSDDAQMQLLLIEEAQKLNVPAERLVFAGKTPSHAEHLARYRLADLFLDTSPYNAHTTASDALWAGLPVVTCMGKSFSSRVAGSILNTLGMPELVTENWDDFVRLAVEIANTPGRSQELKSKLAEKRSRSALYDSERYTLNLERLFLEMHRRRVSGEPSAAFRLLNDGTVQAAEPA